jgi:murein L,D-transpeptidase YcbB/YkuD
VGALAPCLALAQGDAHIQSLVSAASVPGMRWPDFRDYRPSVQEFYAADSYAPVWVQGGRVTPRGLELIQAFKDAWQKGLEPEDYDASRWDARRQGLERPAADPAETDVALTVSAMRYISDLHVGRINPQRVNFEQSVEQKKYDLAEFLRTRVLASDNTAAVLASLEPPFPGYRRTEQALVRYVQLAREDNAEQLPVPAKPLEPGQPYAGSARLSRLLHLLGDLPSGADSGAATPLYDTALAAGVKRFQRRHGLDDDGRLGPTTVKELNVPLTQRVRQLQLALERWRWAPSEFSSPPIIVNVPDFRLRALDAGNTVAMDMRVVVGKAMHTETPVFSGDMSYIVFRPYWVVPPGIMRRQIIPSIQRNRNYIAANRYEVTTRDGKVVTSGEISDEVLAALKSGKLMVRQRPGPKNALGLVKLMFPNEHSVYLHSTPSTELFARARRDFSSGCIRVEKPAELSVWVLRDNPGWTLERVQQAMQSGPDNVTVRLARRTPVFIVYGTAIAYPDGEVHFYDDLYGHDARLEEALSKRYPRS